MKRTISLILVVTLWASLTAFAWLKPPAASSDAERRPLEQFPEVSGESLLSGQFMKDFADYAVDQFPLRDSFRTLNAYLSYYLLGKKDNNGIYLHGGYAAKMCAGMILLGVIGLACAITAQYFAARAAVGFSTRLRHAVMAHRHQ